jgi:response regulator RpfG family c-di-GMP phosphodiesterase
MQPANTEVTNLENSRIVRALVVDADPSSGPAHRKRLEEEGYRVVLATDPAAASLLAKKAPPSIIFINPGGQANAASNLIEALKADTYTRHIPVRLLTHSYDQGPGKKALTTIARNAW